VHHYKHRVAHDVLIVKGQHLPSCGHCGEWVRFELLRPAEPMYGDVDFSSPLLEQAA
jgi:hypothetical protein